MDVLVVISDLHCGSRVALMPPEVELDENNIVKASPLQMKLWDRWNEFWEIINTRYDKPALLINGDFVEGSNPRNSHGNITNTMNEQRLISWEILKPLASKVSKMYGIRGTQFHGGKAGEDEEAICRALKTEKIKNKYCHKALNIVFSNGARINFMHHGRIAKPSNSPNLLYGEWVDHVLERFRHGFPAPHMVVRSHGHAGKADKVGTNLTESVSIMTPAWKLLDSHGMQCLSARNAVPEHGGVVLYVEDGKVKVDIIKWGIEHIEEVAL